MNLDREKDTICAVSTPAGHGGLSIIRVSGARAIEIVRKIQESIPSQPESHKVYFGNIIDPVSKQTIDEVVSAIFFKGKSFTGEETVEISCHGSPVICQLIINSLIELGCRIAEPGEFTYRAFMNGRIDLVQAEGVLSMITAQSQQATRQALRQLKGQLSTRLVEIEKKLIWCLANIEASIDFSTEGLEVISPDEIVKNIKQIISAIDSLLDGYRYGQAVQDGFKVVLVGEPNVGKSSVFNSLIGEDRAIVTEIAGTTRDLIENAIHYKGYRFVLVDTAGLRSDADRIEKMGIEKSLEAFSNADISLIVLDGGSRNVAQVVSALPAIDLSSSVFVLNKIDLFDSANENIAALRLEVATALGKDLGELNFLPISALKNENVQELKDLLIDLVTKRKFSDESVISQARHFDNLNSAKAHLSNILGFLNQSSGSEFIALDLKESLIKIQETLGKRFDDEVMDKVFKEFCIGK